MKRIDVAIGVVFHEDRILICKRPVQAHLGGFWEFPGGKIEPQEDPSQCLLRELGEELGIAAEVVAPLPVIEHDYPDRQIRLHPYLCAHTGGDPRPLGCDEVRWVHYTSLNDYKFPPANDVLIAQVIEHMQHQP